MQYILSQKEYDEYMEYWYRERTLKQQAYQEVKETPERINKARTEICSIWPASFVQDTAYWIKKHVVDSVINNMPKTNTK